MLEQCLEGVRETRRGRTVVVAGEAGVGKTSLVRSFCADHDARVAILAGNCEALFAPRSLGPVLDIADAVGGELREALKGGAQLHDIVTALLSEVRKRAPAVLVVEDLHWADEATLDVLRLVIRKVEDVPVLVLVTHRDDELERTHPLRRVLGELATDGSVRHVKLVPLSPDAVAELAAPHGVDAGELYRMTAGNPFFVVEALASGVDGIPTTVRDAVLARGARLVADRERRARGGGAHSAARGALAARGARRIARWARGMPDVRDAPGRPGGHRVPARTGAACNRGIRRAEQGTRAPPAGVGGARRPAHRDSRSRQAGSPCRRGGRA